MINKNLKNTNTNRIKQLMKYFFAFSFFISSSSFSYIYADFGNSNLDKQTERMQRQDIEDRLNTIESKNKNNQNIEWQKELFESINN